MSQKLLVTTIYSPNFPLAAIELNLHLVLVVAGFPSPADDYIEAKLDLNEHLIRRPAATFFVRASGDSMQGVGIYSGDLLVVDRSLEPKDNDIIIAVVNGELTVKRLHRKGKKLLLVAANESYPSLEIDEYVEFQIWGVVTSAIRKLR
ncbi:umuD protein [Chroococcidiopsis cubana SAG 39.79]|uniref:UmuD protein n=1 Tax=Chroococcidiopsis cubana SAG 39.79 TaxID=388085 RepID=A0AB37U8L0_9CYAN|nr:translesion error-prone DNA polymerase V autoproteolytic subunit [Chroococcidiopsis cubana]RUS95847.1 umuD protein [Chroococcidiopsis cubana SAG 39.79]